MQLIIMQFTKFDNLNIPCKCSFVNVITFQKPFCNLECDIALP